MIEIISDAVAWFIVILIGGALAGAVISALWASKEAIIGGIAVIVGVIIVGWAILTVTF